MHRVARRFRVLHLLLVPLLVFTSLPAGPLPAHAASPPAVDPAPPPAAPAPDPSSDRATHTITSTTTLTPSQTQAPQVFLPIVRAEAHASLHETTLDPIAAVALLTPTAQLPPLTVPEPLPLQPPQPRSAGLDWYVEDSFDRTVSNGLGSADVGGPYSLWYPPAAYSVTGDEGQITVPANNTRTAVLGQVSARDMESVYDIRVDQVPTSGHAIIEGMFRQVGGTWYRMQTEIHPNGEVIINVRAGSVEISRVTVPGLTYQAGDVLRVRTHILSVTPTSTELQGRVWRVGTPEPSVWHSTVTDSTPALQTAGAVGFQMHLPGTSAGATFSIDNWNVVQAEPPLEPENQPPLVDAGPDQVLDFANPVTWLRGQVLDDGLGEGELFPWWLVDTSPAGSTVTFDDDAQVATRVRFDQPGTYVLHLDVEDDDESASDTVRIDVVASADLPDVQITAVDEAAVTYDGQALVASGTVAVTVTNSGASAVAADIELTIFAGQTAEQARDPSQTWALGTTTFTGLGAGQSRSVNVAIDGEVPFVDTPLVAFVDSAQRITELDETNNLFTAESVCRVLESTGTFTPILEMNWPGTLPVVDQSSSRIRMAPVVADLNRDGTPDIIFISQWSPRLRAISGDDGREVFTVRDGLLPGRFAQLAVGDLDNDGWLEIVTSDGRYVLAYDHTGTLLWESERLDFNVGRGGPALADLDQDGVPEIVVGNAVLDPNGIILAQNTDSDVDIGNNGFGPLALVADLNQDGTQEIVAGRSIYRYVPGQAHLPEIARLAATKDGFPAVANFDTDPLPEIVLVSDGDVSIFDDIEQQDATGQIPLRWGPIDIPGGGRGGAPTVADMDQDDGGQPEIGVAGGSRYAVFEVNTNGEFEVKWESPTDDSSSNTTGSSVFDFEGDGRAEVVYGDEVALRIYDGRTGDIRVEIASRSRTGYELPVIADVDGDGNAEIVKASEGGPAGAGIQVYGDANDQWVATRPLWNQHTYHITNINDDGSIPRVEAPNWETFNNYRQNTFRTGCATLQPDLTASYGRKTITTTTTLTARIGNGGQLFVPPEVAVSWYDGNPTAGGSYLGTSTTTTRLEPGAYEDVSFTVTNGIISAATIWVVADDPGDGSGGQHRELAEDNNAHDTGLRLVPGNAAPVVNAGADQTVDLAADPLTLAGTAQDPDGLPSPPALTIGWRSIQGPTAVRFSDRTALAPTATFAQPGTYVLQLTASDGDLRSSAEVTITVEAAHSLPDPLVPPPPHPAPASDGNPLDTPGLLAGDVQRTISEPSAIHIRDDVGPHVCTAFRFPADTRSPVTTLATNVTVGDGGTTHVADIDSTTLANGAYVVQADCTPVGGGPVVSSGVLVTVVGNYKPGRVRFEVTDMTIPLTGLPITVGRVYDSLERSEVGDFGYGWSLAIGNPKLEVSPNHDVTLTMPNGERVTFSFTPRPSAGAFGYLQYPEYTPEAGVYGELTANGCPLVVAAGGGSSSGWLCFLSAPQYAPTVYTYEDPYGTVYTMDADGSLRTITDLNENQLTFTPDGILSSTGREVVFVRDGQGRITTIIDPEDNRYVYDYDANGDLEAVTYPAVPVTGSAVVTYDYYTDTDGAGWAHLYRQVTDPLGQQLDLAVYDADGRLSQETEYLGTDPQGTPVTFVYSYTYDLENKTSTTTNPDGGQVVQEYASFDVPQGRQTGTATEIVRETVDVRPDGQGGMETSTTTYAYDEQRNVVAMGLPDPTTGAAAPLATDPATCAVRNICNVYDGEGNQTRVAEGHNENGQLVLRATTTNYNAYGRPIREVDPTGTIRTFTYDAYGNFETLADDSQWGIMGGYTYDPADRGNPETRYLGNDPSKATTYTYDAYGNVTTQTDPLGNQIAYTGYDIFGNPDTVTLDVDDGFGTPITQAYAYDYNDLGQMTETTIDDGSGTTYTTRYTYDQNGRQVEVRDVTTGWSTTSDYYRDGSVRQVTASDGSIVSYTYTWRGEIATMTDADGRITRYQYDLAGNQTSAATAVGTADEVSTSQSYDLAGRETVATDARGQAAVTRYDDLDRPLQVEDPLHGATHPMVFEYNAAGRLDIMMGVDGIQTHYQYDTRGFPEAITYNYADGQANPVVQYQQHDGIGNVTQVTDRNGKTTTYGYDPANRLRWVKNHLQEETSYVYDGFGQVRQIQDAEGHLATFDYDRLGRVIRKTWHDGSYETFTYTYVERVDSDPANDQIPTGIDPLLIYLRVAHRLADGQVNYTYSDWRGQLDRVTYYDATSVQYRYTTTGQVASVTDQQGDTTCYAYDARDRLTDITHIGTATNCDTAIVLRSVSYTYDANSNRTSMVSTVGSTTQTVGYAYDALDRICAINAGSIPTGCTDPNADYIYTYEDAVSDPDIARRETLTYPNGAVVQTMTYDTLYRLTELTQQDGSGTTLASYSYAYHPAGNRQSLNETVNGVSASTTWTYDDAYRLARERREIGGTSVWDLAFTYDRVGNRQTMSEAVSGVDTTYTYQPNGLDQIAMVEVASAGGTTTRTYSYDARGNLTSDGNQTYSYDAADRLQTVSVSGSPLAAYAYDAAGRRVQQTTGGTTATYLWDEASPYGDVVAELNSSGAVDTSYVLAEGRLLAQERGGTTHYLLGDAQGSTRLLATSSGTIAESYLYDAFGTLQSGPASPATSYLYTGQQHDAATGLYSLRARYYNPADGRFLSRDTYPIDFQNPIELNRYVYTANNPVNMVDPSGLVGTISYAKTHQQSQRQGEDHKRYISGRTRSKGADAVALYSASVYSGLTNSIRTTKLKYLLLKQIPFATKDYSLGVGTVRHLRAKVWKHTTAVSIKGYPPPWKELVKKSGLGIRALNQFIRTIINPGIGERVKILNASNYQRFNLDHAETAIMTWAMLHYGAYPTPHRVLSIATTTNVCSIESKGPFKGRGPASCEAQIPLIIRRNTLLFEKTQFVSWRTDLWRTDPSEPF